MNTDGPDRQMDKAEAQLLHDESIRSKELLVWTIVWGTPDFGEQFICRPHMAAADVWARRYLRADTLEDIRAQLPPGLTRIEPHPGDDAVIVEIWL